MSRAHVATVTSPASRRTSATRKGALMLVLAVVFLPLGVPRWLGGDAEPVGSDAADFAALCREHGGTPRTAPASGTATDGQRLCTVRYGGQEYVMDAITPAGFDADTARFQRQGCREARRAQRASTARGDHRQAFVYHPTTGVCEHRL